MSSVKSPEEYVQRWILETPSRHPMFSIWCIVGAMYSTGLCARCVVEDSARNEGNCAQRGCRNRKKIER